MSRSEEPRLARQVQGQVLDIRNLPRFFSSRIGLNAYLAKMKLRKKIKENESLQKAFEKAKESAWDILTYRPYTARDLLTISFAKKELDAISLQPKKTIGMYLETVKTTIVVNLKDVIEEAGGI